MDGTDLSVRGETGWGAGALWRPDPPHPSVLHWSLRDDISAPEYEGGLILSSWSLAGERQRLHISKCLGSGSHHWPSCIRPYLPRSREARSHRKCETQPQDRYSLKWMKCSKLHCQQRSGALNQQKQMLEKKIWCYFSGRDEKSHYNVKLD